MQEEKLARASRWLIYFILAVLPLERIPSLELVHPFAATVRLSQVAGLILIGLNLPTMWRARRQLTQNPWRWLAAFWLVCVLSAALSEHLKRPLSVTAFTIFVGVLAWVVALRFERDRMATYFKIIIWSALAVCAFGVYQFFGDLLGLPASLTGLRPQYTKDVFGFPRIQSTGLEPLYFADYLMVPAGLLIAAIIGGFRRRFSLLALLPIATIVWLTVSRGAIVALAVALAAGAAVGAWRRWWRPVGLLLGVVAVSVALAFGLLYVGTHVVARNKTESANAIKNFSHQTTNISNGESAEGRTVTRDLALKAFKSHPVLGIGPGAFGSYAASELPSRFSGDSAIVNNEPLELLAETGILGVITLLTFFGMLVWTAVRTAQTKLVLIVSTYGLILALGAIALQYQTFSTLYITHIWVATGLLAGLGAVAVRTRRA